MDVKEADLTGETMARRARPWWIDALLSGPADLPTLPARVAVTVMIAGGAVCTLGSGVTGMEPGWVKPSAR